VIEPRGTPLDFFFQDITDGPQRARPRLAAAELAARPFAPAHVGRGIEIGMLAQLDLSHPEVIPQPVEFIERQIVDPAGYDSDCRKIMHSRMQHAFVDGVKVTNACPQVRANSLSRGMEPSRTDIQAWLNSVLGQTKLSPTALASKAGVAQSTITRFLNSPDAPMISLRTLAKIAHAAHVAPIGPASLSPARAPHLAEQEAVPYRAQSNGPLAPILTLLATQHRAVDPWLLQTDALELAGYLRGDVLLVDLNAQPHAGDIVCAQLYRWSEGRAETVFRLFEPPYLVAMTRDPEMRKPALVDNDRVIVKGVVILTLRARERLLAVA
jgi:transcriptional regulator with XRE-family HTH domain